MTPLFVKFGKPLQDLNLSLVEGFLLVLELVFEFLYCVDLAGLDVTATVNMAE